MKVIYTTDIHGCLFPYDFIHGTEATVSLSQIASLVKEERRKHPDEVVLLDGGDTLQGQPACYISNFVEPNRPNLAARAFNHLGYDAVCVGNHDIETGHAVYDKWRNEMNAPAMAANIIDQTTHKPYFKPYTIIERQSKRIAILALTTTGVPYWLGEKLWHDMEFCEPVECARHWIKVLKEKEKPDIIIGMFHSGWQGGINAGANIENFTRTIAEQVDGFDLILFGHDHKAHCETVRNNSGKDVLCVNPSSNAYFVAVVDINTEGTMSIEARLIDVSTLPVDEDFTATFHDDFQQVKTFTETEIGYAPTTIFSRDSCFGPSPLCSLIHRVQRQVSGADISFAAPLCFDETFRQGVIRIRDIFKLYQNENTICSLLMSGREIKDFLEMSYDLWVQTMQNADDHIMLVNHTSYMGREYVFFKNLVFNFESASGIAYTVDVTKQRGNRIAITSLDNGRPFSMLATYTVAMHSYRASGGTEFLTKGAGIPHEELPKRKVFESKHDQRFHLIKYIKENPTAFTLKESNWRFIPEDITTQALLRDKRLLFGE